MALWTPYAEDTALDLTKTICSERTSPLPAAGAPQSYHLREFYYRDSIDTDTRQSYYGYNYQSAISCAVPQVSFHMSQTSTSSVQSGTHFKPPLPSPPDSISLDIELLSDDEEYQAFERDALQAMAEKNGGKLLCNNPRMRREVQTTQAAADASYRRQRERNNFAAKQSRDRRKLREIRLALQVQYLNKKVADLKTSLATGVCGRCRNIREC